MDERDRKEIYRTLATTPQYLDDVARRFGGRDERRRPAAGGFSLVEHAWHLAEIEEEAYLERVRRVRQEHNPLLPDFDGDRIAAERQYQLRNLKAGLDAFARVRAHNLAALREIPDTEWNRPARQERFGALTLADIPLMMAEHDTAHRQEIDALNGEIVVDMLEGTPRHLRSLVAEFKPDALHRVPSTKRQDVEALSPIGHACHFRDIEIDGYHVRIRRLLFEINPTLESRSGEQLARERTYEAANLEDALGGFEAARAQTLETLRRVAPKEWSRTGLFEGYGRVTLLRLIEILVEHDRVHLEELTKAARR
jgi:hypothetical protein